jgi:nucleoside-diphosphate-sugar epimerase
MGHYLVTGVAGFIASQVAQQLLSLGHTVVGLDNLNDAYDVRIKEWRLAQLTPQPGFSFQRVDISHHEALAETFGVLMADKRPEAVINLAARAGVRYSVENPWVYVDTNVTGTLNLLELCRQYEIGKFVLASTSSLYGAHNPVPFSEDADTNGPLSPYAASKKGAEALCYTYHYLYDMDVTVYRYFTVYGEAGRPDMSVFRFIQWINEDRPVQIYGDGSQSRDFTYVGDIARGTIAGLKPVGYEVINLGSDTPIGLLDAIRLMERTVGKGARLEFQPRHKADMMATWADVGKAERLLGWRSQVSFEEGIRRAAEWYAQNRSWAKDIVT